MRTAKFWARSRRNAGLALLMLLAFTWSVVSGSNTQTANAASSNGAVYSLTNAASGNGVAVYKRAANGSLNEAAIVFTGGNGSGSGLGSQGALVKAGRWLLAVNAGSNSISVLEIDRYGDLRLVDTAASGGTTPISLTYHNHLVYVLNAGGSGNISGLWLDDYGHFAPLSNSTRPLSGAATTGPAEVSFSPDGSVLVVAEKATNKLDSYVVYGNGRTSQAKTFASSGTTPFGFSFDGPRHIVVSEAFGGAANASAVSSYTVAENGNISVDSASVATHQTAACWIAVTPDGKYAYSANAGSDSLSGYSVSKTGQLTLLNSDGRTGTVATGSHPIDEAVSADGRFLYVLGANTGNISAFAIQANGQLNALPVAGGLPLTSGGLVAY